MKKLPFFFGLIFLALSIIVFIFADGLRRYYSGIFFLVVSMVLIFLSRPNNKASGPEGG
jgi:hypothetical protein